MKIKNKAQSKNTSRGKSKGSLSNTMTNFNHFKTFYGKKHNKMLTSLMNKPSSLN